MYQEFLHSFIHTLAHAYTFTHTHTQTDRRGSLFQAKLAKKLQAADDTPIQSMVRIHTYTTHLIYMLVFDVCECMCVFRCLLSLV
jgi:hypothetical protein